MTNSLTAWFSVVYVGLFWVFLATRIVVMRRQDVNVLTIAPRRKLLNALGAAGFLGILAVWSGVFVYLAFAPCDFALFRNWNHATHLATGWVGLALAIVCQVFMWLAIVTMGRSWRIGIDDENPGELVTHGVFRLSRNPIFVGLDGIAIAAALVQPNGFFLAFGVGLIAGIHIQILGEERHLDKTYAEEYSVYRERTPRYLLFF
jgi:protein-S-isoprenylcysteine O-methyltransferase Ste14